MTDEITEDEFEAAYGPTRTSPDGSELWQYRELPSDIDLHHVWSCTEGDDGGLYLGPGYHVVNMVGYVITERPWTDALYPCVIWDDPNDHEDAE